MKIAITGGKGGTGKSTIATALAYKLSEDKKVLLLDLDVDCPNDNLILNVKIRKVKDVKIMIPRIDKKKCVKCGSCSKVCREHAIVFIKNHYPFVIPEQCIGCKACKLVCPVNAIKEKKQKIGEIFTGKKENLTLIGGKIKPGVEESSLVVNEVKSYAKEKEDKFDYVIIDTAAGIHCHVISALLDCDIAFAVTEPTPFGAHDLDLILKLIKELKIKNYIILNRCNIGEKNIVLEIAKKNRTNIIANIPYRKEIEKSYSQGKVVEYVPVGDIVKFIKG